MDLRGLVLILLGIALLLCVRDAASVAREIQPRLFRFNYPRISRWLPKLPDYLGVFWRTQRSRSERFWASAQSWAA